MPLTGSDGFVVMVTWLAFYVVLPASIVIALIRAIRNRRPDPRTILAERLARHEITQDEFETAMRALGLPDPRG